MRLAVLAVFVTSYCQAYSVLTHEAVIDSVWDTHIRPLLLKRYPQATPEELKKARAYVYGGALVQDMGYVPLSSKIFSDLTHYVRSGDFVTTLLDEAANIDDYAFGLGTLAHYASDSTGHQSINRIAPLIYPKLRRKFGEVATYEDNPGDHLKTEFALDVIQVARGQYAPDKYHDFIGFEVAQDAMARAFQETYGIPLKDVFVSENLAIGTFRFAAGSMVPEMTKVAWSSKRKDIEKLTPGITRQQFVYSLPRHKYEQEWDGEYRRPGIGARFLAWVFRLIPTFGPFKSLGFKPVPPEGEKLFLESFDATVERYRSLLTAQSSRSLKLAALNLDTGKPAHAGEYMLADKTYEKLLDKLADRHFESVSPALRADLLRHFSTDAGATVSTKALGQIEALRAFQPAGD
jgi:zinc dependent phospholipase C